MIFGEMVIPFYISLRNIFFFFWTCIPRQGKPMGLIKLKRFFTAKEIIDKMKRQLTEWKKIFANDTTDKGFTVQTI